MIETVWWQRVYSSIECSIPSFFHLHFDFRRPWFHLQWRISCSSFSSCTVPPDWLPIEKVSWFVMISCFCQYPVDSKSTAERSWKSVHRWWFLLRWRSTNTRIDGSVGSGRLFGPMFTTLERTRSTTETNARLSDISIVVAQVSLLRQTQGKDNVAQGWTPLHTRTTGTGRRNHRGVPRLRDLWLRSSSPSMSKLWISPKRRCTMREPTNALLKTVWVISVVRFNWSCKDEVLTDPSSYRNRAI